MKTTTITPAHRADVLRTTWALVRKAGGSASRLSFSDALKKAWAAIKIKLSITRKATGFFYAKDDGTERYAVGFNSVAPARPESEKPVPYNPLVIKYYDVLVSGWRSFRVDRLILE